MNDTIHNVLQQQDSALDSAYGLNNNDREFNCLPCICWHKILFGARLHKILFGAKMHKILFGAKMHKILFGARLHKVLFGAKMHKILFGARFITAGKKCINKQTKQACYISIQDMLQPNRWISF